MNLLREPLVLFLAAVLLGWGVFLGSGAPAPLPADTPNEQFSAGRAESILQDLYQGLGPHVSGSPTNRVLRQRIEDQLLAAGYEPQLQSGYYCSPLFAACSPVENLVAVLPGGGEARHAILVTAHYDSAWAAPGVSDDGAGVVAVLEIARMAARGADFSHDIIFLFSDAEEQGLIGAYAFAAEHPAFERVRAVINLEARGVAGPSAMFETAPGNRGIIRLLAKHLDRPMANSLTYEMYRRMPNDTDFSVYRAYPIVGVNFAFTEGVAAYHSQADDLDRLDRASLQHHGQNAWSVLRALDERTLDKMVEGEDAVYVDLLGRGLLHYPVSTAAGLALVISVLVLIAIRRSYSRQVSFRQMFWSLVAVAALVLAIPGAGWLLSWPLGRWPDLHGLDHPWPWAGRLALFLSAIWLLQAVSGWLSARASTASVMSTVWGLYALLALALATTLPAAAFIPLLPLLAFMLGLGLDGLRWRHSPRLAISSFAGFVASLYIGFYLWRMLETITSFSDSALSMAPMILPAVAALPLLISNADRRGTPVGGRLVVIVLVLVSGTAHVLLPAYSVDRPRDMSVYYRTDAGSDGAWMVLESSFGRVDPVYARSHGFRPVAQLGGLQAQPVEPLDLPELAVRVQESGTGERQPNERRYRFELVVPQDVRQVVIQTPESAELTFARVGDQIAWDETRPTPRPRSRRELVLHQPPPGRVRIELEWAGAASASSVRVTTRYDLPAERLAPFMEEWPTGARPAFAGPRAEVRLTVPLPSPQASDGDRPPRRNGG
ncbi:M20/M25/M40 family metallo-hydrolase [Elongatibacter sediminis]|uniref:Vacuolar membrane protease n=1 Tax=Elongatibacter sediminis TaxID=3119006 RepID=A0AAW9RES1_9GAMM